MKRRKNTKNLSSGLLIITLILLLIAMILPKETLIVDDFEEGNISDWNETGFGTISYNATFMESRGNTANIAIQTNRSSILYRYGSFQKEINQNWEDFEDGKISYWIKFSDYYGNISRVALSFGEVVSGGNQTNKANYCYIPKTNDWQKVSFKLNEPDSILGKLFLKNIKKIRFNIEYDEEFYESGETFNVYIDDIKLSKAKLSPLAIILCAIAALTYSVSILLLLWGKIKKGIINFMIVVGALFILSILLMLFNLSLLYSLRIVFGSVYVLFLPGFFLSYIFFPKTKPLEEKLSKRETSEKGSIDWIERMALSFALSIAIVPLLIFYLSLTGMKINLMNSFLTISGIIAISLIILRYKYYLSKDDR